MHNLVTFEAGHTAYNEVITDEIGGGVIEAKFALYLSKVLNLPT